MNYIEFQIGEKLRGFKFGLSTLGDIMLHYGVNLHGLMVILGQNVYSATPVMLFYAHRFDCVRKGEPFSVELHEFSEWLDELDNPLNDERIASAMTILVDSIDKYIPQPEKTEQKLEDEETEKEKKS